MKILVTGALGQVGSDIVTLAKYTDFEVHACSSAHLDITDFDQVLKVLKASSPDIVINAAAYTAVDKAETDKLHAYRVNCDGPENIAKVCQILDVPLFHISTDYVFDGQSIQPYLEEDRARPIGIYGDSKLQGDYLVQKIEKYIILRVSWVFGEGGNNFVKTMLNLVGRDSLKIVSDQVGTPTWSRDIAKTLLQIAVCYRENRNIRWGLYNYCGKPSISWHDFADQIFSYVESHNLSKSIPSLEKIKTSEYPCDAKRPLNTVLDCKKINQAFGIEQIDWKVGLRVVINNWNKYEI